jgi:tyrosine-protein kinase Etk/Wzc
MNEPMYIEERQRVLNAGRRAWIENISLLLRYKWFIIATSLLVTIGTAVYLFGFAKTYYLSTANVLPARKSGGMLDNLASGISSTIKDLGLTQLAGKNKADGVYSPLALIESRELKEQVVKEFGLMKVFEADNMQDAVDNFSEFVKIDILEEGNIALGYEDTDPKRAAAIANRLVQGLNEVNSHLAMEEAKFNKAYVEMRWSKLMNDLDSAERALGEFQRKYGVYELKEQARAQLEMLGTLETQRYSTEIQLRNAEQLYGSQSAETQVLKTQLEELNSKLYSLKNGMDRSATSYFVPMEVLPGVALDYLRLTREVEIQSKLKAFMIPTYEQAKLDESRQSLNYIVLDKAIPPIRKSRPKRASMLLMTLLGSLAVSSLGVIALVNYRQSRERFRRDRKLLGL